MVYFVRIGPEGPVKIGTTTELRRRLKDLEAEYGVKLVVLGVRDGGLDAEREHHRMFDHLRLNRGHCKGRSERFSPGDDLLDYVRRECRIPDLLDGLPEGERACPVRLDLPIDVHRLLRVVAADDGKSMAAYAREVLTAFLEEEIKRQEAP